MNDLLKLLETINRKRLLGTVVLGRGKESFEIFFEEDFLYIPGRTFLPKVDIEGLVATGLLGERVSVSTIENLAVAADLTASIFPEVLRSRNVITEDEFQALAAHHLREEIFSRILDHPTTFHFQDGHVPDTLIGRNGVTTRFPTPIAEILEVVRRRFEQLNQMRLLIPSDREVFVITEKGMAKKQDAALRFGHRKILELLDGFRTLRSIIDDGLFFSFHVERLVVELLVDGWIRKTVVPEIQGVDLARMTQEEAQRYVVYYKNAIKYGTDEIKAREGYAALAERLGRNEEAVAQYNFIGDTLYQMRRKALAVRAYQKGLALSRGDPLITEKIIRIYTENAEEALRQEKIADAVALYRKALQLDPDNRELFGSLLDLHISRGKLNEAAELCDRAAARSKERQDPTFAVEILQHVIGHFAAEPVFKKKLINLYLDFGMTEEAADAMEGLARTYLDAGQTAHGVDLIDKVLRLDPRRKHLRKLARGSTRVKRVRGKRRRSRVGGRQLLTTLVLLAILAVAVYQLWAYVEFRKVAAERYLVYDNPVAAAREVPIRETKREVKLRAMAEVVDEYRRRFRFSVFRWEADKLKKEFLDSASQIERMRNHEKKKILETGRALFRKGEDGKAIELLERLRALGPDDTWGRQAGEEIDRYRTRETAGEALRRRADEAIARGDTREAHRLLNELVSEYPGSRATEGVRFPVEIAVVPPKLAGELHDLPRKLMLEPARRVALNFEVPGYEPLRVSMTPETGSIQVLFFNQKPIWTRALAPPGDYPLRISEDRLFYLDREGDLEVVSLASGKSRWKFSTPPLIGPTAPILVDPPRFYLPLNNSTLLEFRLDGESRPETRVQVEGLIQTPLVSLTDDEAILFGTSRRTVVAVRPGGTVAATVRVPETPVALEACGDAAVLVLASSGVVYRIELVDGRVAWESRFRGEFIQGPALLGRPGQDAVVLEASSGELVGLDPVSGNIQWRRRPRSPGVVAALLRDAGRILLCDEEGVIVEVEPRTNRQLGRWDLSYVGTFARAVELRSELGFFCRDGCFVLLDPATMEPRWRYAGPAAIRSAAWNGTHLVLVDEAGTVSGFLYPLP